MPAVLSEFDVTVEASGGGSPTAASIAASPGSLGPAAICSGFYGGAIRATGPVGHPGTRLLAWYRQMTLVPSWQQLAPNHQHSSALQQQPATALLQAADASDWGRHLLVDQSGGVHQDQRSIFPVDLPDVYDTVSVVDHWPNNKRNSGAAHKSALFTLQVMTMILLDFIMFFS